MLARDQSVDMIFDNGREDLLSVVGNDLPTQLECFRLVRFVVTASFF
jgi:hypothetical protein